MDPIEEWEKTSMQEFESERLHFAASKGDVGAMQSLIDEGFDVNGIDQLGLIPLHYAVQNEHKEAALLLIGSGAKVNGVNEEKIQNTPLCKYAARCSLDMARLLIEHGANPAIGIGLSPSALDRARQRKKEPAFLALFQDAIQNPGKYQNRK